MMPATAPPVAIYAGDTAQFPSYTFSTNGTATNFVAEGWSSWGASWRNGISNVHIELAVDISKASMGIITMLATAAQTREMRSVGVWDLQAHRNGGEVRTFITGATTYQEDVTL